MSKKTIKLISVLALVIAMIAGSALSVCAESYDYTNEDYHCYFQSNQEMETNFDADAIAKRVEDLQPGDDVTFEVTYQNNSNETTDWYMENTIEKTLESTRERRLAVSGVGDAENGGYNYELIHYDKNGKEEILFNNTQTTFGGESVVNGRKGLSQASNALEEWFYIQTLEKGESGSVVLKVAFEGETEVNDYMDTDGGLNVRFAVEVQKPGQPEETRKIVKTGDYSNVVRWVAVMMAASVLLIVLAIFSKKRDRKEDYNAKH